VQPAGQSHVHR